MNIIKNLFTPSQKVFIKSLIHSVYRVLHNQPKIDTRLEYLTIGKKGYDTFFGYYDVTPFNSLNEILFLKKKTGSDVVEICLSGGKYTEEKVLAVSKAWNWQQGSRLRWFPGSDEHIVFNTFENGEYGACVINKSGHIVRLFKYPLYDISSDGRWGATLNFERLGVMRPGYGYTCKSYKPSNLQDESIGIIDIKSGDIIDNIAYEVIASSLLKDSSLENCYINHLAFSPDGNFLMFFWIEVVNGYHQASLCVYDRHRQVIIPLETDEKVSHYVWIDNENILCTSYKTPLVCRYFVYNVKSLTKKVYCPNSLKEDGHPSVDKNAFVLTDTYPDRNGFQYLYIVDSENDSKQTLFKVYMKPVTDGEKRTDLHPRFNATHKKICFDINKEGYREMVILNR